MLGAIAGDIIGSIYEHSNIKTKDFSLFGDGCRFTDDTVCSVAIADCLLNDGDFGDYLSRYALRHPGRGYGSMFRHWAKQWERKPYGSFGNGSAMRVAPIGWFCSDEQETLLLAERSASVTHNHPAGIVGAKAVAWAVWAARHEMSAATIRREVASRSGYEMSESVEQIREWYTFDITCAGTVPQAITCALEAKDYEDAIRNAVSIGGDTDTVACITGGVAEALFGLPETIADAAQSYLTDGLRNVTEQFDSFVVNNR